MENIDSNFLQTSKQGLYVMVFKNRFNSDIFDNNRLKKVVVFKDRCSVKSGKYESSFENRIKSYRNHLHINNGFSKKFVFDESLCFLYTVDTSKYQSDLILSRSLESIWNQKIYNFLKSRLLIEESNHNKRSEWIPLIDNLNLNKLKVDLKSFVSELDSNLVSFISHVNSL